MEPRARLGAGLAYSTPFEQHLLNIPAAKMSDLPSEPPRPNLSPPGKLYGMLRGPFFIGPPPITAVPETRIKAANLARVRTS